jgi:hypothetical protein
MSYVVCMMNIKRTALLGEDAAGERVLGAEAGALVAPSGQRQAA